MKKFSLGILLFLLLWIIQVSGSNNQTWQEILEMEKTISRRQEDPTSMRQKTAGAILKMTVEFLKDMDMKMIDVYRLEHKYIGVRTSDFGAGKLYQDIETRFKHMIKLYKTTSRFKYMMEENMNHEALREKGVGSLQSMLSDYNQLLSIIDLYRFRKKLSKKYNKYSELRDLIQKNLISHKRYPYNHTTT
ncbi:uncharacterized protein LOC134802808 isoform X2 [Cydia splendana]